MGLGKKVEIEGSTEDGARPGEGDEAEVGVVEIGGDVRVGG